MRKFLFAVSVFVLCAALFIIVVQTAGTYDLNPETVEMRALGRLQKVSVYKDQQLVEELERSDPRMKSGIFAKLTTTLNDLTNKEVVDTKLQDKYGLREPELEVTYEFEDGRSVHLRFGNVNTYLSKRYVATDEEQIVLASEEYYSLFTDSMKDFKNKKVFLFPVDAVKGVSVVTRDPQSRVDIVGGTPAGWLINGKPSDPVFLGGFLKDLGDISYENLIERNEQQMAQSGLLEPQATLRVQWQDQGGADKVTTLAIGAEAFKNKKRIGYFALCNNTDKIMILAPYAYRRLVVREENLTKAQ